MFAANSRASSAKLRSSHICKVRSKSSGHLSWLLIKSFGCGGIAQKRLLCGVSVGVFYALCLSLTTALSGKPLVFDHVNLALLAALLFGGTAGGVLSALGAVGNTAPER